MRPCTLLVLLLAAAGTSWAQTSAYQDADGHSSLYLMNAKANLVYNVSDSKFSIGYLHEPNVMMSQNDKVQLRDEYRAELKEHQEHGPPSDASADEKKEYEKRTLWLTLEVRALDEQINKDPGSNVPRWAHRVQYGLSFSGKPSTDLGGQIFQASNSPASIGGGGSIGIHGVKAKSPLMIAAAIKDHRSPLVRDDTFLVDVDFTRSTFGTVTTGSTTVTTQHFNGFNILPTYNAFMVHGEWQYLLGVSGGVNRTNNSGDLKKVMVNTTVSQSGGTTIVKQTSAYLGDYKTSIGVPIYADFAIIPPHLEWISVDLFERANAASTNGYGEGGIGLFIAKPKKPTEVLGGVSASWKDGKSNIAIVAGWSF